MSLAFLQQIGMPELLVIGFIILLLFGAKRLPELFRSMGKSIGEFKKATREIEDEVRSVMDEEPETPKKKQEKPKPVETSASSSSGSSSSGSSNTSVEEPKEVSNN